MTEAEYRSLCLACDRALLAADSTAERIAISWLHVVREHPVFLRQYEDLFAEESRADSVRSAMERRARQAVRAVRRRLRTRSTREEAQAMRALPGSVDVLFISHLINTAHAGAEDDFYFGSLPAQLSARGRSCVVALIDQTRAAPADLGDRWAGATVPRVVLPAAADRTQEARLSDATAREAGRLRARAGRSTGLDRRVLSRAAEEAADAVPVLALAERIGSLVTDLRPGAIVVTYEGHAWERLAFAAARRAAPHVRCIGYQHAAVFRLQHAIRRSLGREYDPQHIFASGIVARDRLSASSGLRETPVSVVGSARSFSGTGARDAGSAGSACLVIPEGIESECDLLFEFALECATRAPHITFLWRMHPILSFDAIREANPRLRDLPPNVELSAGPLEDELSRSAWAIYRGTTTIVPAVLAGIRPFYLRVPGELTIDPLYDLESWRLVVTSANDVARAIAADEKSDAMSLEAQRAPAIAYCRGYFEPWNVDAMLALIPVEVKR